jgi:hypothetical protein
MKELKKKNNISGILKEARKEYIEDLKHKLEEAK